MGSLKYKAKRSIIVGGSAGAVVGAAVGGPVGAAIGSAAAAAGSFVGQALGDWQDASLTLNKARANRISQEKALLAAHPYGEWEKRKRSDAYPDHRDPVPRHTQRFLVIDSEGYDNRYKTFPKKK